MQPDLFPEPAAPRRISEGAVILPGFALGHDLLPQVDAIAVQAPFRHFQTPGGRQIGVEMTNAGPLGWVSDRHGYRYQPDDPLSGKPWPAMPPAFLDLAMQAAAMAGFAGFRADACLINRYRPGVRMGLHHRTGTKRISACPSSQSRSACRSRSSLAAPSAAIRSRNIGWRMAMSWSGVARRVSPGMVF